MISRHDKGTLFIISAPSGTGKSTLLQRLTKNDPHIRFSVSHTTRSPRVGEEDGKHYHFVTPNQFMSLKDQGAFLEWANYADHYYGTSAAPVFNHQDQGLDVLLEIEVMGARQVWNKVPDAVSIFIMPPHYQELKDRLEQRGKDSGAVIEKRLGKALDEMKQAGDYDYLLVNDNLETCYQQLRAIVTACRSRTAVSQELLGKVLDTFPKKI